MKKRKKKLWSVMVDRTETSSHEFEVMATTAKAAKAEALEAAYNFDFANASTGDAEYEVGRPERLADINPRPVG